MANFMDLLQGQLGQGLLKQLSGQGAESNQDQTSAAANLALTTLMNALKKNASTPQGLESLNRALDKHHDGGILDNVMGALSGTSQNKAADGMGILSHLLGGSNIFNVVEMISKGSGTSRNNSMNMLMKLAPIVLGVLGKQKKQQQMQPSGLAAFLNQSVENNQKKMPQQNLITKILDRDGDGSAMDEIAGMGMKVLGNLFR